VHIYILDDEPNVIFTLTAMAEELGHEVKSFTSPSVLLENISNLDLGCIFLDYSMPEMNGLDVQKRLLEMNSLHSVLLLTGVGDIPEAMAAMRAGAIDCLRKPPTMAALAAALTRAEEKLAKTRRYLTLRRLSDRERNILKAIGLGKPSKIIAYELGISIRTVDMHRSNLLHKLGVSNSGAAVMLAQQYGLLADNDDESGD
jgi:two-component system, LuxR family, response regulator FixJ